MVFIKKDLFYVNQLRKHTKIIEFYETELEGVIIFSYFNMFSTNNLLDSHRTYNRKNTSFDFYSKC